MACDTEGVVLRPIARRLESSTFGSKLYRNCITDFSP